MQKEKVQDNGKRSVYSGGVFISMGEYIKLVEREKEPRSERSTHWEAETDLRAPRKLRNQRRVDNLHTNSIVGKVLWLPVYYGPFSMVHLGQEN